MAVPEAELEPVPEQTAAQSEDGEPKWCCHCRTSPAQSQTAIVCTILTDPKYGYCWKQWPTEEWTYKGAGPTPRTRPRDSKRVDFTNSGFHAGRYTISSVDETEMLYDRLNLCDLTGARDNIDSDICPPTYIFSAQYSAPEFETERSWMDEGVWFLKENLQNYGQGTWVVKTPKQASKLVQKGKDYVLQPHIAKPLLYDGRKFHIRLYLLIVKDEVGQYPSSTGYNNRFYAYDGGHWSMSSLPWSAKHVDKTAQVTIGRTTDIRFADWEFYDKAWVAMLENLAALTAKLSAHMEDGARTSRDDGVLNDFYEPRTNFEMVGCDYMLDTNWKAWLLEVNTGPVVKPEHDTNMLHGVVGIVVDAVDVPVGSKHRGWQRLDMGST